MVDLWCEQNDEKQAQRNESIEQREIDARQLQLEKEQSQIENQINQRKRLDQQELLNKELQQQIFDLRKISIINFNTMYIISNSESRESRQNKLENEEREILREQQNLEEEKKKKLYRINKQKQEEYQKILYRYISIP